MTRVGLWAGILGPEFLILAMYLSVRGKMKNCCFGPISGCLGGTMGSPSVVGPLLLRDCHARPSKGRERPE